IHSPGIPMEIMACGICPILSGEIARKQAFAELRDGEHAVIVDNPEDINDLAKALRSVIEDPARAQNIGHAASRLVDVIDVDEIGKLYEHLFELAIDRHEALQSRKSKETAHSLPDPFPSEGFTSLLRRHIPVSFRLLHEDMLAGITAFCDGQGF